MKNKKAIIFVNFITMIRLIGTFLMPFVGFILSPFGLVMYIICLLLTDCLDGLLARRLNACTTFGALLDALADKLLGIATLAVIGANYPIMFIPILTEIIIVLVNTKGATLGSNVKSSFLGKFKTWIFGIAIVLGFCIVYAPDIINILDNTTKIGKSIIDFMNMLYMNRFPVITVIASICIGADIMVIADYSTKIKQESKNVKEKGIQTKNIRLKKKDDLIKALFDTDYYNKTKDDPILERLGEERNEKSIKRK